MKPGMKHLKSTACAIGSRPLDAGGKHAGAAVPDSHRPPPRFPVPQPGNTMTKEYVQMVGRMAYFWGWPLVANANRAVAFSKAPEPGLVGGVVPIAYGGIAMLTDYITADQRVIACSNQDVVYGPGFLPLDKEPFVFQVPDFGDRFWVYALYDARTDEFSEIGKQYGTKPGFYLIVGPDWKGETPAGITAVVRSSTALAFAIPRIFMDDTAEDRKAIQPVLSQINFYPLSQFDGKMKIKDWSKLPHFPAPKSTGTGETKWVNPETYFDELPAVMKQVPPLPGEEALYKWIGSVLEAAAKDPAIMQTLKETAVAADREMIAGIPSVAPQRPRRRQRLELAGEQCEVGHRLPQPHRHRQVEHLRQPPGGDQVHLHGQRQPGPATQWSEHLRDHLRQGADAAGQRVLVADPV